MSLEAVSSCTVFDAKGKVVTSMTKGAGNKSFLARHGGEFNGEIIRAVRRLEAFAGRLDCVVMTFDRLAALAMSMGEGTTLVLTVASSLDVDCIRNLVNSNLAHIEQ